MTIIANHEIAEQLRRMADVLVQQGDRGFRPAAYRRAAETLDAIQTPISEVLKKEGMDGLVGLPTMRERVAA